MSLTEFLNRSWYNQKIQCRESDRRPGVPGILRCWFVLGVKELGGVLKPSVADYEEEVFTEIDEVIPVKCASAFSSFLL